MDGSSLIVAAIVAFSAVWVAWTVLLPPSARRAAAGWVQRKALEPGRSKTSRARLLRLADRLAPRCCQGKD